MNLTDLYFFFHFGTNVHCIISVVILMKEWYENDDDGSGMNPKIVGGKMRTPMGER
jgi:hypothetical protein